MSKQRTGGQKAKSQREEIMKRIFFSLIIALFLAGNSWATDADTYITSKSRSLHAMEGCLHADGNARLIDLVAHSGCREFKAYRPGATLMVMTAPPDRIGCSRYDD